MAALKENEGMLETLREQNETVKSTQNQEIEYYIEQKKKLLQKKDELLPKLRALEEEEEKERSRVSTIKSEYDALREQTSRTIDDLTHGIRKYGALGLEFQKAQDQCMKFIFTLLDPNDPSRQFAFLMRVDDDDKYCLVECQPALPEARVASLVTALNNDNDIGKFVVNIRRGFQGQL